MAFKSYLDLSGFVPKRHWTLDLLFRNVLCIPLDVLGRIVLFFFFTQNERQIILSDFHLNGQQIFETTHCGLGAN